MQISRARVSSASKEVGALREDHKQKSDAATKIAAIRKGKADRVKVLSMKNVNEGDESALASLQRKASEACTGLADAVSGAYGHGHAAWRSLQSDDDIPTSDPDAALDVVAVPVLACGLDDDLDDGFVLDAYACRPERARD